MHSKYELNWRGNPTDLWIVNSLRGEPWPTEAHAVGSLPAFFALAVPDSILLIHHLLQQSLVVSIEWSHTDIPDCPELTTVVQVLIFQSEEVPDKPPQRKRKIYILKLIKYS